MQRQPIALEPHGYSGCNSGVPCRADLFREVICELVEYRSDRSPVAFAASLTLATGWRHFASFIASRAMRMRSDMPSVAGRRLRLLSSLDVAARRGRYSASPEGQLWGLSWTLLESAKALLSLARLPLPTSALVPHIANIGQMLRPEPRVGPPCVGLELNPQKIADSAKDAIAHGTRKVAFAVCDSHRRLDWNRPLALQAGAGGRDVLQDGEAVLRQAAVRPFDSNELRAQHTHFRSLVGLNGLWSGSHCTEPSSMHIARPMRLLESKLALGTFHVARRWRDCPSATRTGRCSQAPVPARRQDPARSVCEFWDTSTEYWDEIPDRVHHRKLRLPGLLVAANVPAVGCGQSGYANESLSKVIL